MMKQAKLDQIPGQEPLLLRLTPFFYYPRPEKGWPIRFDPMGGMQVQTWQEATLASQRGVKQMVLTLGMQGAPNVWQMDERTEVRATRIPWPPIVSQTEGTWQLVSAWGLGTLLWMLKHSFSQLRDRIKLVHCHCDGVLWPLWIGPILARWANVPLIFTIHCSRLATYQPMTAFSARFHPFAQKMEIRALSKADHIFTLTQRLADIYVNIAGVPRERVSVVSDAVNLQKFTRDGLEQQAQQLRDRLGIPRDRRIVMFAGRIAFEKGWQYLARASALLPDPNVHIVFCGDGPQRQGLEMLVDECGQRERTTITGFLSHDEMPAALSLADIFVLPSIHEEFGSSLLEAMSMQLPIVATRVGGVPNVIHDEVNGLLVPSKNPEAMAQAIQRLLDNPELARQLAAQGHQFVHERYGSHAKIDRILDVYRRLEFMA